MKVKILTIEQAKLLGLMKKTNKKYGKSKSFGVGGVVSKDGDKETLHEKFIVTENNKKELTFISEERVSQLKKRKQFSKYMKQFNKIPKGVK